MSARVDIYPEIDQARDDPIEKPVEANCQPGIESKVLELEHDVKAEDKTIDLDSDSSKSNIKS